MLFRVFVFVSVVGVIFAAVAIREPVSNPYKDEEGCFIEEFNSSIPFNSTIVSNASCLEYACREDSLRYLSCGAIRYPDGCKIIGNNNDKPYPACCFAKVECPELQDNVINT